MVLTRVLGLLCLVVLFVKAKREVKTLPASEGQDLGGSKPSMTENVSQLSHGYEPTTSALLDASDGKGNARQASSMLPAVLGDEGVQVPRPHEKKPIIFVHMSHGGGTYWKDLATLNGEKVCGIVGDDVRTTVRRTCATRRRMIKKLTALKKSTKTRPGTYGVHKINRVPNTKCDLNDNTNTGHQEGENTPGYSIRTSQGFASRKGRRVSSRRIGKRSSGRIDVHANAKVQRTPQRKGQKRAVGSVTERRLKASSSKRRIGEGQNAMERWQARRKSEGNAFPCTFYELERGLMDGEYCPEDFRYMVYMRHPMEILRSVVGAYATDEGMKREMLTTLAINHTRLRAANISRLLVQESKLRFKFENMPDVDGSEAELEDGGGGYGIIRIDNGFTRYLAGSTSAYRAPIGAVGQDMLEKAMRMVERFDVAITSENFLDQTQTVQHVLHSQLNWTVCPIGAVKNNTNHHSNISMSKEVATFMREQNWADIKLFNFASDHFKAVHIIKNATAA